MSDKEMNDQDVRALYCRISNWGRWGAEDELGTLNFIEGDERRRALSLAREGCSIGLANPLDTLPSPMNNLPAQHYMVQAADMMPAEGPGVAFDYIGVYPHGQAQSHLDALCHISHNGKIYNGRDRTVITSKGARSLAISAVSNGIVGRGVLLDIAGTRGVDFIDQDKPVRASDLEAAEKRAGTTVGKGDIVIYRVGRHERRAQLGPQCERSPDGKGQLPGIYPDCLEWFHSRQVALIGSDCAHDVLPAPFKEEWIPIHVGTEVYLGMLLLHNLRLDQVLRAAKDYGRNEFCIMLAPLNITGGTASPINPIVLF